MHNAAPGIEKAEVVIYFRNCTYCRSGVAVGRLLIDRDRRREALQAVHLRLLHLPQELPRIAGERLHIAPLPLCVDRIKGKTALARSRQAGHDHQLVARDVQVNILQIMLSGSAKTDILVYIPRRRPSLIRHKNLSIVCCCSSVQVLQNLLQLYHLVTQLRCCFEVQVCGRLSHLLLYIRDQFLQFPAAHGFRIFLELRF